MKRARIHSNGNAHDFLQGGGELGELIRTYDWSQTSLGPVESWPRSLRTCVRIMLTSSQPIWIGWGPELIKLYNDPYKQIVGGKHPEALGQPASVVWKDIWKDIEPLLTQVMQKNQGTYTEAQLLIMERYGYPEETYYTFSYNPVPGDDGGTAGMICFNTDNTTRIVGERQLKTINDLSRSLANCESESQIFERAAAVFSANRKDFQFAALYRKNARGFELQASTGISDKKLQRFESGHSEKFTECLQRISSVVVNGVAESINAPDEKNTSTAPRQALLLPIVETGYNEPFGLLLVGVNPYRQLSSDYINFFEHVADQIAKTVVSVHSMEAERTRAEALAEIDRAKTIFFSNISHEFRTPLTLLLGPVREVLKDPGVPPEHKQNLELAYRNGLRMQKLVNTLLDFSRIEAGRFKGSFQKVDIVTLTKDLASSFRSAIEKSGMELVIEEEQVQEDTYVDVSMWEKIVLNLISNAFKYTVKGRITLRLRESDGCFIFSVKDTGIGIPEAEREKIFERFHRAENASGRSQEGTGIGLAMVRELVKLHQGSVSVESKQGAGSEFTVSIPLGKNHIPDSSIAIANPEAHLPDQLIATYVGEATEWLNNAAAPVKADRANGKPTILIADDNADMRQYIERLLSTSYNVLTASNGEEAYQLAAIHEPDAILSDIMMPKLDGYGLLRAIRSDERLMTTPIIFVSARAGEEAKAEGLIAGADDYLIKPFSVRELLSTVESNVKLNTVRQESLHQLKLSEERFRLLSLSIPQIVWTSNADGRSEYISVQWQKYTGEKVINGQVDLEKSVHPEDLETVRSSWKKALEEGSEWVMEYRIKNKEGRYRWFMARVQPLKDAAGNIHKWIGAATDIQDLKDQALLLEQKVIARTSELKASAQALKQSNEDLQQFAHVASHDLREPLRKIKTFIGRLEDDRGTLLSEKGKIYLQKVNNATSRMSAMIEGVLHYSLVEAFEDDVESIDLGKTISQITDDLELVIRQKKASITWSGLPTIHGAPILIYQLFYNLINNSLKFSKEDVPPTIHLSASSYVSNGIRYTRITMKDNGIGFDQHSAGRIFNTFERLHSKDKYEGTGLGLSLCKKIVQRHHGEISAAGKINEGAAFFIDLPLHHD